MVIFIYNFTSIFLDLLFRISILMIDAIKNGDVGAFETFYILNRERLYNYFLKKVKSEEDAKDLLQVTFAKLWQYRKSLSPAYLLDQHLFHTARTVFIDYLRTKNKLQKVKFSVSLNTNTKQSEDYMNEFDMRARFLKMLSEMPALRRRIFELKKIEGYSYKEIAAILSISVKDVDNNLVQAIKYLKMIELLLIAGLIRLLL
jgi:RNA polymerase sigma factor (sigma-70 family)